MTSHESSSSSSDDAAHPPIRPVRITPGESETVAVNDACFANLWDHLGGEVTLSETQRYYDIKASRYDEEMAEQNYRGPKVIVDKLESLHVSKQGRILDVGCGTGLLGVALKAKGFSQLLGIDMSSEMLRVCGRKNIYSCLEQMIVRADTDLSRLERFDAVCLLSSLRPGHVSPACLENLSTVLKPGSCVIWARSSEIPSKHFTDSFKPTQWMELKERLESRGVKCLEETRVNAFWKGKPGELGVFRKD